MHSYTRSGAPREHRPGKRRVAVTGIVDVETADWVKAEARRRAVPVAQVVDEILAAAKKCSNVAEIIDAASGRDLAERDR